MNPDQNPRGGFSKRDLAYLLFKRKDQIVAVLAVALLLTTLSAYIGSREYEAYASIYVERSAPPVAYSAQTPRPVLDRKETLNSEIDFMMSRAVLGRAADEILAPDPSSARAKRPPPGLLVKSLKLLARGIKATIIGVGLVDDVGSREGLIDVLRSNVEPKSALNSNIITVIFADEDPRSAARVVNTVTRVYLEERLKLLKRPGIYSFYADQIRISRERLEKLRGQVQALKADGELVLGEEQVKLKLEELRDLDTDIRRTRATREELRHKIETVRAQLSDIPAVVTAATTMGRNPELAELTKKLATMRDQRARDVEVYRPESQKIVAQDRAIVALEAQIAKASPTVLQSETVTANDLRREQESVLRSAEVEFRSVSARENVIAGQMETLREELQRIDARTAELASLTAALQSAERTYLRYVEQQEEARITDATNINMTNVDVIHYAAVPERPKRPRIVDILIGAALGLFMGVVLAFAAEFFDHSLENRDDVEGELGLPLLASLPDLAPEPHPLRVALTRLAARLRRRPAPA